MGIRKSWSNFHFVALVNVVKVTTSLRQTSFLCSLLIVFAS